MSVAAPTSIRPTRRRLAAWLLELRLERMLLVLAYTALYSLLSIRRHEALKSTALDLALFDNLLWNTAHGHLFESWMPPFAMGNYMADHLSPILLVLAIPYLVQHDPRILLVLQSAVLGLGAVPVASLAERRLGSRLAGLFFGISYLAYPFIGFLNLWDFHQEAILVTALLWAFDLADRRRFGLALACLVVAVSTKEEAALVVAAFGIYLTLRYRAIFPGLAIMLFGAAYFVAAVELIIPAFRQGLPFVYADRYAHLGATPLDAAAGMIQAPDRPLRLMATPERITYLRDLFLPLPFALLAPLPLLASLPVLAGNLLSGLPLQYNIMYHYSAGIVPGIVVASVEGARVAARVVLALLGRLLALPPGLVLPHGERGGQGMSPTLPRQKNSWGTPLTPRLDSALRRAGSAIAFFALAVCLLSNRMVNSVQHGIEQGWFRVDAERVRALDRIAAVVPPDASLTASWAIAPHFTGRRILTPFPVPLVRTEYALVDLAETYVYTYPRDIQHGLGQLQTDGYVQVAREGPFVLLRRAWDGDPPELGRDALVQNVDRVYGDALTLISIRHGPQGANGRAIVALDWRETRATADHYGVRLRWVSRHGEALQDWWHGLSPRVTPWMPRQNGLVSDRYYFDAPPGVAGLVAVHLMVEPYRWPQQEYLPPSPSSEPPGIRLRVPSPFDAVAGRPVRARFGDLAILESHLLDVEMVERGQAIAGALRWRALEGTDAEYTVSVQLIGEGGLLAQDDARPNRGYAPTSSWRPGDLVDHQYALSVPQDASRGRYRLVAILYDARTGARLSVSGESFAELGSVEIR